MSTNTINLQEQLVRKDLPFLAEALAGKTTVAEGANTTESACELAARHGLEMTHVPFRSVPQAVYGSGVLSSQCTTGFAVNHAASNQHGVLTAGHCDTGAAQTYTGLDGVRIVALAGMEQDLRDSLQAEYSIPNAFADWKDMLEHGGLDAISVAVPTFLHAPIAIAALEKGLHVLSEKPLARNPEEARQILAAAAPLVLRLGETRDRLSLARKARWGQRAPPRVKTFSKRRWQRRE